MISLTAALEGVCTLWPRDGKPRQVPVVDFVTGNHTNVLQPGELLRSILLPAAALRKRFAFRQVSLTHLGRSAALLIGTVDDDGSEFLLTDHRRHAAAGPVCASQDARRGRAARRRSTTRLPPDAWFQDVHGSAPYKRHMTFYFAEQIRAELST